MESNHPLAHQQAPSSMACFVGSGDSVLLGGRSPILVGGSEWCAYCASSRAGGEESEGGASDCRCQGCRVVVEAASLIVY
jgi:hypothetical protein